MKNKKLLNLVLVVAIPLSAFMAWRAFADLFYNARKGDLMSAIARCGEQSQKYQGADRVREFVTLLNKIEPDHVSPQVRSEFEHYRNLWNQSLNTYDKNGNFGNYDKEIEASVQKLKDL